MQRRRLVPSHPARVRLLAGAALVALSTLAAGGPASADSGASCSFDAATGTATVALAAGEQVTLSRRQLTGTILVDGASCSGGTAKATVDNTQALRVQGAGGGDTVKIDLANGPFAPIASGASAVLITASLSGSGDAVKVQGGPGVDGLVAGTAGVNLRAGAGDSVDLVLQGVEALRMDGGGGNDLVSAAGGHGAGAPLATGVRLNGGTGRDEVDGGAGADVVSGDGGPDTISLGGGDDDVDTSPGADWIDGGDGRDALHVRGSAGVRVNLATGHAAGRQTGAMRISGIEDVMGGRGRDVLVGDDGHNVLRGGAGADVLAGGAGDDTLDGGQGADTVSYAGAAAGVSVSLATRTGAGPASGTDLLAAIENATGSPHDDVLLGTRGRNVLRGGGGDDQLVAGGGNDVLAGGPGDDREAAGAGDDVVPMGAGRDGADQVTGGSGVDVLLYSARRRPVRVSEDRRANDGAVREHDDVGGGFERIVGGAGDDRIAGGYTANVLVGGRGADSLFGGGGNDRFISGRADGRDTYAGGSGIDTIVYVRTRRVRVRLDNRPNDGARGERDNVRRDVENVITGSGSDTVVGSSAANRIIGGGGADRLVGGGGRDVLSGGAGADALVGGGGNDRLLGGPGADVLWGGGGRDRLAGGPGADRLDGGPVRRESCNGGAGRDRVSAC